VATSWLDTVLIAAVSPVLGGLVRTRHARNASGRGGRTAASSSTDYGTTSCLAREREAPPEEWSLLAGEAIQNLRSSLDHIVYAASGERDWTQFPIFTSTDKYREKAPGMLPGVPDSVKLTIEKAQPYNSYAPDPGQAMLEQLRLLSNLDKHRTLATVASAVEHEGVGHSDGVTIEWQKHATNRPLSGGEQHVSTFTATADDEAEIGAVTVEPMVSYEVRIEGRPINYLRGIVHDIYPILYECETGQPLSPFAPYPLS
jgi:hypothetical protein